MTIDYCLEKGVFTIGMLDIHWRLAEKYGLRFQDFGTKLTQYAVGH